MLEFVPTTYMGGHGLSLRPGTPYICFEPIVKKWLDMGAKGTYQTYEVKNGWAGGPVSDLLLIGGGGMGDRIQMTPALREVSRRAVVPVDICNCGHGDEWRGLPYVGNVFVQPPTRHMVEHYEAVLDLCGVIGQEEAKTLPLEELFAWRFGVELTDRKPEYRILPGEERLVRLPEKQRPRIGVHLSRNGPARIWPSGNWLEVMGHLSEEYEVLVLGEAHEAPQWQVEVGGQRYLVPPPSESILDWCGMCPNVRALAVVLKTCDLFIGTDSGPLHLAGTLDVPSIGLYGPFSWELRGKNLPSIEPIQATPDPERTECSCFTHVQVGQELPCKQPYCSLMEAITPEHVVTAARSVMRERYEA